MTYSTPESKQIYLDIAQAPCYIECMPPGVDAKIPKDVRAKAGLPWPVSGTYRCDKCHNSQAAQAGDVAARCVVVHGKHQRPCNCAYFVLVTDAAGGAAVDMRLKPSQ